MRVVLLTSPSGVSGSVSRRLVVAVSLLVIGSKFNVVDDKDEASVATSPLCCFHRGCEFCALLLEVVYCCVRGLAEDSVEGNCGDLCLHHLTDGCFVGC